MIVSFLHVGDDLSLPEIMVASVRKAMPGVRILQMTDEKSPVVDGCEIQVLPYDGKTLMTYRLRHLAVPTVPMVILDTDVIVQSDLSPVLRKKFDVALTRRTNEPIMYQGRDIAAMMPYNTGVMFSRCPAFWQECLATCEKAPLTVQIWWGDQISVRLAAESGRYTVLELDGDKFNYSPKSEDENVSKRHVVHYKGDRKEWMVRRGS